MSPHIAPTLCLTTKQDVEDLVKDLRAAYRQSLRTGGAYPVYRTDDDGQILLAVQIRVPLHAALDAAARRAAAADARKRKGSR